MKKYIFSSMLLGAALTSSFSSCADMLAPESDLVMYEEDNTLSTANDTLYSVIGVLHLMQRVADRTNLLGEVRSDLLTVTESASIDLKALSNFEADLNNVYNQPQDYYAIVNNCNYFIEHADADLKRRGQKVFERELATMHTFRAWAYLQLAINYGEVPYFTEFLSTEEMAEEIMNGPRADIKTICNHLIEDLTPWSQTLMLTYQGITNGELFIPTRLMLGELCLWAERYTEAAQWYHDFLNDRDKPRPSLSNRYMVYWLTSSRPSSMIGNGYLNTVSSSTEVVTGVIMENTPFDGIVSNLESIYCSGEDLNQYYYEVEPSDACTQISAEQRYYYVYTDQVTLEQDTVSMNDTVFVNPYKYGDLRLYASIDYGTVGSSFSSKYNDHYVDNMKVKNFGGQIILYRLQEVYLHYAEALNRAGFPSAAFSILKYGLCPENIERGEVDPRDVEAAGDLIAFDEVYFSREDCTGIHSRGCGDAYANPEYVLPMPESELASYADTVAFQQPLVEDLIITESALELAFEGKRYYDLLRVALRRGDVDYLADKVARRADYTTPDPELKSKLQNQKNWYLPFK